MPIFYSWINYNGPFSIANCWSVPEGKTWGRKASSFPMVFGPLDDPKQSRAYGIEDDFLTHATYTRVQVHMWKECQIRMLDRIVRVCYKYLCQYVSIYLPWWGFTKKSNWSWFVLSLLSSLSLPGLLELNHTHDAGIKHPRMAFLLWCLHMVQWFVRKAAGPTLWRHHQFISGSLRITNHATKKSQHSFIANKNT